MNRSAVKVFKRRILSLLCCVLAGGLLCSCAPNRLAENLEVSLVVKDFQPTKPAGANPLLMQ
jgi:hypothetical protein